MNYTLIKDSLPEKVKASGEILNYAECKNDELYSSLLLNKLVETVNEFLSNGTLYNLDEISLVTKAIYRDLFEPNLSDTIREERATAESQEEYTKRYIGFFSGSTTTNEAPAKGQEQNI